MSPSNTENAEDVYNNFSIKSSALTNGRSIWTVNFAVDPISFYIGGLGGVCLGYMYDQYEPSNINNEEYINQERRHSQTNILNHMATNPLHVMHRFFVAGGVYTLFGLVTSRMLKAGSWARPFACGGLTGLYFSYGNTFTQMAKGTATFSLFALLMEVLVSIVY